VRDDSGKNNNEAKASISGPIRSSSIIKTIDCNYIITINREAQRRINAYQRLIKAGRI